MSHEQRLADARITGFLDRLRALPAYAGQIVHVETISPRTAAHGELARPLPAPLAAALPRLGVERLYLHQAEAINAARDGRDVMVVTPTASGKTLCYNLPVFEALLRRRTARALYLFPTKALAQDQMRAIGALAEASEQALVVGTYDGDTPREERARLRRLARILITNPDMLQLGILPNQGAWAGFLRNLRFVVIDEAHVYRGIFGSHVANVIRRLLRLCAHYGNQPRVILCSATIANPGEHAHRLTGRETAVVDRDGSPSGGKRFVFWNPPLLDQETGRRRSPNAEGTLLFTELVRAGLRNITFARARKMAELVLIYAREVLEERAPLLAGRIASYRAGYLPEERRAIERGLFSGELMGITATNALELGIDVGSVDATVLLGYPGTIASTWQQAGRSGRGADESLSVLVGLDDPLDQYYMRHPDAFFGRPHEHALIDPRNPYVLRDHLAAAAFEAPLSARDEQYFGPLAPITRELEARDILRERDGLYFYAGLNSYPAQRVRIRSASEDTYAIIDTAGGRTIGSMDGATAFRQLHPGAIYLHQGESYLIERLDVAGRAASARRADIDYYTQPRTLIDLRITAELARQQLGRAVVCLGQVEVTEQVVGFRRKQQYTESTLDEIDLELPPRSFATVGLWFTVPGEVCQEVSQAGLDLLGGLHAAEHAAIGMLPLFAMCDRWDIGGLSTPLHVDTGQPSIFIHDGHPGGTGISEVGYRLIRDLWRVTLQTLDECPCQDGCPGCVHSPKCGNGNEPLDKRAAAIVLRGLLAASA